MPTIHATVDTFDACERSAQVGDTIVVPDHDYRYVIEHDPGPRLIAYKSTGEPVYTWSRGTWY